MNELILKAIQRKMDKLERKLERYASIFFCKDITIMYIPKVSLKNAKLKDGE